MPETISTYSTENFQASSVIGPARLLSLPSFAKVVYDTAAGTGTGTASGSAAQPILIDSSRQLSLQSSIGSKAAQTVTAPDSQPVLLQRSSSLKIPTLEFDSQFESGNLQKAVQVGVFEPSVLSLPKLKQASVAQAHDHGSVQQQLYQYRAAAHNTRLDVVMLSRQFAVPLPGCIWVQKCPQQAFRCLSKSKNYGWCQLAAQTGIHCDNDAA